MTCAEAFEILDKVSINCERNGDNGLHRLAVQTYHDEIVRLGSWLQRIVMGKIGKSAKGNRYAMACRALRGEPVPPEDERPEL